MPRLYHKPEHLLRRQAFGGERHLSVDDLARELSGEDKQTRYDRNVRDKNPWMKWYKLPLWRNELRPAQLRRQPNCACGERANTVDHKVPHHGDWNLFRDPNNLQSKCGPCHTRKTVREREHAAPRRRS